MRHGFCFRWLTILAALMLFSGHAASQAFPSRTMRMVTSTIGGASDLAARLIAQHLPERTGQAVVIDNRGGGTIAGEVVLKAEPDGHTLLVYGNTLWLLPLMRKQVPYDPVKDFAPVTLAVRAPAMMVIHPSIPAENVKELIAYAKKDPDKLNYASGGAGGIAHLSAEMFISMSGANITRIPFKGTGPALNAILGNHVQVMFGTWGAVSRLVETRQLRALAVTSAKRSPSAPNLPTLAEAGLPGYDVTAMFGVFAHAKTPAAMIKQLNQMVVAALRSPDIEKRLRVSGSQVVAGSSEEFRADIQRELAAIGPLVRARGITDN